MFLISEYEQTDKELTMVIIAEKEVEDTYICFRLRDNERFELTEHNEQYRVKPISTERGFELKLATDSFLYHFTKMNGKTNIIDLHIASGDEYYKVQVSDSVSSYVKDIKSTSLGKLVELKSYITVGNTIAFKLINKDVISRLKDIVKDDEDNIQIAIETILSNSDDEASINNVLLRKRVAKDIIIHSQSSYLARKDSNTYVLSKDNFNNFSFDEKTLFDIIVRYRQGNVIIDTPLSTENFKLNINPKIDIGPNYDAKVYINKGNSISVNVQKLEKAVVIDNVSVNENNVILRADLSSIFKKEKINNPQLAKIELQFYQLFTFLDYEERYFYKSIKVNMDDNLILEANLNMCDLFESNKSNLVHNYIAYICIKYGYESFYFTVESSNKIKHTILLDETRIDLSIEDRANFAISNMRVNPVKIAVLGSCFSRSVFNSNEEYFNPDYKKYFEIVYSHFWHSVISSVSEPVDFDSSKFSDLTKKEQVEAEREFGKNTFEKLSEQDADYILIDFYNDAMHGVLKMADNKILTRGPNFKNAKYFTSQVLLNSINIDFRDEGFFELWKNSCDIFVRKLKTIVPEERIILNVSKLTDKYYDEENEVQSFIKKNRITQAQFKYYNLAWTKLDSYFLSKAPNAQVIDLSKYKFLSSVNHPISCGPHHFESAYYKKQLDELVKIVLLNK